MNEELGRPEMWNNSVLRIISEGGDREPSVIVT